LPLDAIQDSTTAQSPKAEDGWKEGRSFDGIKSGTNSIHGTAFAFGRNAKATDAANFFTGTVTDATLEQFGATAGGPVLKDKLFWCLRHTKDCVILHAMRRITCSRQRGDRSCVIRATMATAVKSTNLVTFATS